MDHTPKTESINDLIKGIDNKKIVLPEFQRNFVWDINKTLELFDSLVRGIFVGSIIYGVPSFEVAIRELDTRPRSGEKSRRKLQVTAYSRQAIEKRLYEHERDFRLVLDGQQRITSLYRALKTREDEQGKSDIDEVWFVRKDDYDIPLKDSQNDYSLEDLLYRFDTRQDPERLSIKLSDVYTIQEEIYDEDEYRKLFFDELSYVAKQSPEAKRKLFKDYRLLLRKLQNLFRKETLLPFYLLRTTSEKFALFFERSNSKGIELNFIDILAAKLYHGFNLREKIEHFEDNYHHVLDREIIVRSIAFVVNQGKQKIDRSYILSDLTAEHFNEHWDELCYGYRCCLNFLYDNNFILSQSWMPYPNMLLPLMMFWRIIEDFSAMNEK